MDMSATLQGLSVLLLGPLVGEKEGVPEGDVLGVGVGPADGPELGDADGNGSLNRTEFFAKLRADDEIEALTHELFQVVGLAPGKRRYVHICGLIP